MKSTTANVSPLDFPAPSQSGPSGDVSALFDMRAIEDVSVTVEVHLGCAKLSVKELFALRPGDVVELDAALGQLVELRLNNKPIGRGKLVAAGDNFGIEVTEMGRPN